MSEKQKVKRQVFYASGPVIKKRIVEDMKSSVEKSLEFVSRVSIELGGFKAKDEDEQNILESMRELLVAETKNKITVDLENIPTPESDKNAISSEIIEVETDHPFAGRIRPSTGRPYPPTNKEIDIERASRDQNPAGQYGGPLTGSLTDIMGKMDSEKINNSLEKSGYKLVKNGNTYTVEVAGEAYPKTNNQDTRRERVADPKVKAKVESDIKKLEDQREKDLKANNQKSVDHASWRHDEPWNAGRGSTIEIDLGELEKNRGKEIPLKELISMIGHVEATDVAEEVKKTTAKKATAKKKAPAKKAPAKKAPAKKKVTTKKTTIRKNTKK